MADFKSLKRYGLFKPTMSLEFLKAVFHKFHIVLYLSKAEM